MKEIKERLDELYPTRSEKAKFLGVGYHDVTRKVETISNKLNWLKEQLDPLDLIITISKRK